MYNQRSEVKYGSVSSIFVIGLNFLVRFVACKVKFLRLPFGSYKKVKIKCFLDSV